MSTIKQRGPGSSWQLALTGVGIVVATYLFAILLKALTPVGGFPDYLSWSADLDHPGHLLLWIVGDSTEAQFMKSPIAGILLTLGALTAWWLTCKNSRVQGFSIAYGTGLFGWILLASWSSLVLANLLYGWTITSEIPWQPTFVTFVSVPAAIILTFGGGWKTVATGSMLGALLTTPISILVVKYIATPLELPSVIGNVTGMWVGALIAFTLCKLFPWMKLPKVNEKSVEESGNEAVSSELCITPAWLTRRVLADFTEPQFYANEWASAGLILGASLEYILNSASPAYGSGLMPDILVSQVLATTLGIILFQRQWRRDGFYPTFIPIASLSPAIVMTFGGGVGVVILAGVLGAVTAPPLGAWISGKIPRGFHPFIGYVMSMTICVATLIPTLRLIGL